MARSWPVHNPRRRWTPSGRCSVSRSSRCWRPSLSAWSARRAVARAARRAQGRSGSPPDDARRYAGLWASARTAAASIWGSGSGRANPARADARSSSTLASAASGTSGPRRTAGQPRRASPGWCSRSATRRRASSASSPRRPTSCASAPRTRWSATSTGSGAATSPHAPPPPRRSRSCPPPDYAIPQERRTHDSALDPS